MTDLAESGSLPDSKTWQRITDLLGAALELPEEERETFIRDQCGGEDATLHRVKALLVADARADKGFMAEALFSLPDGDTKGALEVDAVGRRVGQYQLGRSLGQGGMGGRVFLPRGWMAVSISKLQLNCSSVG